MASYRRVSVLIPLFALLVVARAQAAPINVAEFRWECAFDDFACTADPVFSTFTLTNVWDGLEPAPTLVNNQLVVDDFQLSFLDLVSTPLLNFDQLTIAGIPALASINVSFLFAGELVQLSGALTSPNSFTVLTFEPKSVPEPGTLGLLAIGAGVLLRRVRRPIRQ